VKTFHVYIMTNWPRGTLYTGMTSELHRRVEHHRTGAVEGFTAKYRLTMLVHAEEAPDALAAIAREKEIKRWRRAKKIALIEATNPGWSDLAREWFAEAGRSHRRAR